MLNNVKYCLLWGFVWVWSVSSALAQTPVRTVVIDAGHGAQDRGAMGPTGVKEKVVNLKLALLLGEKISEAHPDVKVIYTRKTDVFIPLFERGEIANRNKADLFISIHCNANPSRVPYGTETYAMGLHKTEENLEVAKRENGVILQEEGYKKNYKGFNPDSPLAYVMLANYQNAYLNSSLNFASKIEREFKRYAERSSRGVKQAGFIVLWKATMPSVLVECGFLSNRQEEKFLASQEGQEKIAESIFRAFSKYKESVEGQ
jgi:N-acetylmuramoyl-L-alanine amidase